MLIEMRNHGVNAIWYEVLF